MFYAKRDEELQLGLRAKALIASGAARITESGRLAK
jgi:hypothetical protein